VGSRRVRAVSGFVERYQSAAGFVMVMVRIREKGGRRCMRRVKTVVSFLRVWEMGGMAMRK